MKKFILVSLLLLFTSPAFALIVTDNVDKADFLYEVAFGYATSDLDANSIDWEINVVPDLASSYYYVVSRDGRIVGMSVSGDAAVTAGAATFDITINGLVTGVQAVLEPTTEATARIAVGTSGSADPRYAYIRQDRADTAAAQGFRVVYTTDKADFHDVDNPYGRATPLVAGNRVGVLVNTTANFAPNSSTDYVITIYVLE